MKIAVTGAAGFVGTNVVAELSRLNLVRRIDHEDRLPERSSAQDLWPMRSGTLSLDVEQTIEAIEGAEVIVHLAANADVRSGWDHPERDIEANLMLTSALLAAMRATGIRRIVFASTGSVYHPVEQDHFHAHVEYCPVHATSLYAASKIASEQLIHAYAAAGFVDPTIMRFVSVLGPHYSHGHVIDFVRKVRAAAEGDGRMEIIGTGHQKKGYVHVADVSRAVTMAATRNYQGVYNVGTPDYATPIQCAGWVADALDLPRPALRPTNESWAGDNPNIVLDCGKLRDQGWRPQHTIEQAIKETALWVAGNPT